MPGLKERTPLPSFLSLLDSKAGEEGSGLPAIRSQAGMSNNREVGK